MRPVPRARHLTAVLLFVGVSAIAGYFAWHDTELSDSQINIACAALKDARQDLFIGDPVFGDSGLWKFHTPIFVAILKLTLVPTDYEDLTLPFRALAGPMVLLFLGGMYALLWRQTRSWSVSAFVAVMSTAVITVVGQSHWGLGPLSTITPQTLCLAMVPLVVAAFLHYEGQWRLTLVFLFIGLMGNLHLVTAMNLTLVLLMVYLARHKFHPRCYGQAVACGLAALLGALPYAFYFFGVRHNLGAQPFGGRSDVIQETLKVTGQDLLYDDLLKGLLEGDLLIRLLLLSVVAVSVLSRWERFRLRDGGFWLAFLVATGAVAFGLSGLSQAAGKAWGQIPVIDFPRASNLLLLPLYVLLAQGLTNLFRLWYTHRRILRWACLLLMAAWMLPSDNFRMLHTRVYELAANFVPEANRPRAMRRIHDRQQRQAELNAIASWARGGLAGPAAPALPATAAASQAATQTSQYPPPPGAHCIFVTDQPELRLLARRPIVASSDDARYVFYMTPQKLHPWVDTYRRQQRLLDGNVEPVEVQAFFRSLPAGSDQTRYYVVADADVPMDRCKYLQPLPSPLWGKQLRLYVVRAECWGKTPGWDDSIKRP